MTYRTRSWDKAERRPARRHARPRRQYDLRLLFEALLFGFAIFVLVVVASVGYAP